MADAMRGKPGSLEQVTADRWLRTGSDFLIVCELAGLDGHLARAAYLAGSVDADKLHAKRRDRPALDDAA